MSDAAKRRDELVSAITHDLRAPLAAVTMGANFVLQTMGDNADPRSRRILEAMLRSCTQMERLVRNFGDLAAIEGGSLELRPGVHDAGELLELAAQSVSDVALSRSVAVEVKRPESPLVVSCDRDRLLRALGHVVDNAVRFAPPGSTVTVEAMPRPAGVRFEVIDHGPGIPEEIRKNLFDRRWHAARTGRSSSGFGLAIARGFVLAHGGTIDVTSVPGETVFAITLPRSEPETKRVSSPRRGRH